MRSLVGYSPRGRKESDMTERLHSLIMCKGRYSGTAGYTKMNIYNLFLNEFTIDKGNKTMCKIQVLLGPIGKKDLILWEDMKSLLEQI